MSDTVIMLNGHTVQIVLQLFAKTEPTATSTLHVIAMCVPEPICSSNATLIPTG